MAAEPCTINVLGINVSFRAGADMERAQKAAAYVEDRFEELRANSTQGKAILLTYLVLGLADDLLQMKTRQEETQKCAELLLDKIEKALG